MKRKLELVIKNNDKYIKNVSDIDIYFRDVKVPSGKMISTTTLEVK